MAQAEVEGGAGSGPIASSGRRRGLRRARRLPLLLRLLPPHEPPGASEQPSQRVAVGPSARSDELGDVRPADEQRLRPSSQTGRILLRWLSRRESAEPLPAPEPATPREHLAACFPDQQHASGDVPDLQRPEQPVLENSSGDERELERRAAERSRVARRFANAPDILNIPPEKPGRLTSPRTGLPSVRGDPDRPVSKECSGAQSGVVDARRPARAARARRPPRLRALDGGARQSRRRRRAGDRRSCWCRRPGRQPRGTPPPLRRGFPPRRGRRGRDSARGSPSRGTPRCLGRHS